MRASPSGSACSTSTCDSSRSTPRSPPPTASVEAHLGRSLADVLPGLPSTSYLPVVERLLAGETVEPFVMAGETPLEPGRSRVWQEAWHAVRDEDGTIVAVAALVVEVTRGAAARARAGARPRGWPGSRR